MLPVVKSDGLISQPSACSPPIQIHICNSEHHGRSACIPVRHPCKYPARRSTLKHSRSSHVRRTSSVTLSPEERQILPKPEGQFTQQLVCGNGNKKALRVMRVDILRLPPNHSFLVLANPFGHLDQVLSTYYPFRSSPSAP